MGLEGIVNWRSKIFVVHQNPYLVQLIFLAGLVKSFMNMR